MAIGAFCYYLLSLAALVMTSCLFHIQGGMQKIRLSILVIVVKS